MICLFNKIKIYMKKIKFMFMPVTITLWFLLAYYGIYFSIIGFIFIFSLNWIPILLLYLLLFGLFYNLFVRVPRLFRFLILEYYGLTWFACIVHSLAGITALIFLIDLFINKPIVLINSQNPEFFLFAMFKQSPLKTIFLLVPFLVNVFGLLWYTSLFPIILKASVGRNVLKTKSNYDKTKSITILKIKANELIDLARILFSIIKPKLFNKFPELHLSEESEKFNIFGSIAFAQLVCVHLHSEVKKKYRTELELIVQEKINNLYDGALYQYNDLAYTIRDLILNEKDRAKRRTYIHYVASIWILKQIGFLNSLDAPNEKDNEIVYYLTELLENETDGYWTESL